MNIRISIKPNGWLTLHEGDCLDFFLYGYEDDRHQIPAMPEIGLLLQNNLISFEDAEHAIMAKCDIWLHLEKLIEDLADA